MKRQRRQVFLALFIAALLICSTFTAFAATSPSEYPLPRNAVLYSEIEGQLKSLEAKNPNLMDYEVIGQSVEGRNLYLVTISDAEGMKKLDQYQKFMQDAVNDPEKALKELNAKGDSKIPIFFNASIHGNETTGTDAVLKLINKLLTDTSAETKQILKNCVVLINVCQNPDGRASGHRENAVGTDLNRDYITQSQPEVQGVVKNIATKWFPTVMLDLHGFMGSGNVLLEPCTIPHNPNYEYDLALKYALPHAEAISAEITALTKRDVDIPIKVWEDGWDDYPPIFTPQYFMYLGSIGHTLEVKFPNQQGIDTAYTASYASLKYASKNKTELLKNQFTIYERGVKGTVVETDIDFPEAYVIPMTQTQQKDTLEAANMIRHLLDNKVVVKMAEKEFTADGVTYPAGTYVVPMKQGLRGLVNTMLWKGEDVSELASAMYDISAYSFPQLCGFDAVAVEKGFDADLTAVSAAPVLKGTFTKGTETNYVMPVENNQAYKAANALVKDGYAVYRTGETVGAYAPGTFVIPNKKGLEEKLAKLASENAVTIQNMGSIKGKLLPVTLQKIAVIGNDGGVATAMKELGFNVTAIPYFLINNGYDLEKNGFESMVISGTEAFWKDSYEATGITWSLDEVGQNEVIEFAKTHDFIGVGYAGAALNEAAKKLNVAYTFTGSEEDGQTAENGICLMDGNNTDPVSFQFGTQETVFAYAPVWFDKMDSKVTTAATFGKGEMYLAGFWMEPEKAAGAAAIIHDNSKGFDAVLFGIEPTFRNYTPATYGLMANAMYYLGYEK
ncbi:M14 family zinc carboxypeptidase [Sinanaerobacter chloroacetimidivorans]|uniref:Peptidase M14 domain-containing protein n=1 Tax=Sinanaerobacter chloroacetimidivorans TaxID=2818044 RepID=A0A8J8B434_9FIRM|nr:M14 family zinc carboxypeptidase [Sinanaerobacter chloroacetimidivorans]MBR0600337.1 hypothetical protein [Sinanaerobacter chloroacetimidivorans]